MSIGWADEIIPYGARVLLRGRRVCVAEVGVSNGIAMAPPFPERSRKYRAGQSVIVKLDEGIGTRNLQDIANGPIMDSNALYLPAGKISMAEYRLRQAQQILPDTQESTDR